MDGWIKCGSVVASVRRGRYARTRAAHFDSHGRCVALRVAPITGGEGPRGKSLRTINA